MIKINKTKNEIKLIGVSDNSINKLIKNKARQTTLIFGDKTIYLVFKKDDESFIEQINTGIKTKVNSIEFNLNIDMIQFIMFMKNLKKKLSLKMFMKLLLLKHIKVY